MFMLRALESVSFENRAKTAAPKRRADPKATAKPAGKASAAKAKANPAAPASNPPARRCRTKQTE